MPPLSRKRYRAIAKISQSDKCHRPIRTCGMRAPPSGSSRVVSLRLLQEFWQVSTRFTITRGGAFGRVPTELGLQLDKVGEDVGLAAQLVGDHRRLACDRGNHG